MPFWVYILMCHKDGRFKCFYVGQTNDFEARMQEHYDNVREGYTRAYTGRYDWVKPVWKKRVSSRSEALKLERQIKKLSHEEKWNIVKGITRI